MKISSLIKHLGMAALVLGLAAGCASTQQQETTQQETEGPTTSEVKAQIEEAKSVNQDARSMGADWRQPRKLINQAETALENGNNEQAMNLAREAELSAEENIKQYKRQQKQQKKKEAEKDESGMQKEGDKMGKMRSYTVDSGDTLWDIAASSTGYNDPYQWPLIYRANKGKIDDPDLIYPGQTFSIKANPSPKQVDMAVEHAKNRGEWSLGKMEKSDKQYLKRSGAM